MIWNLARQLVMVAAAVVATAAPTTAARAQTEALYRSTFVVSGTGDRNRMTGIAECFRDTLIKLTGDQTIAGDRRFRTVVEGAPSLVESYRFRDRLEGKPIHDEQGTYDRPHDLTVTFDRAGVEAAARSLGREPWLAPRPRVVVVLAVENVKATFMLARDSDVDRSADMRAAFGAAGEKVAMQVAFPRLSELDARGLTAKSLADAPPADLAAIAGDNSGIALAGRIVFSERALGWIARWRMQYNGKTYVWSIRGVNFDTAFRNAMLGAAQILSGHGQPRS